MDVPVERVVAQIGQMDPAIPAIHALVHAIDLDARPNGPTVPRVDDHHGGAWHTGGAWVVDPQRELLPGLAAVPGPEGVGLGAGKDGVRVRRDRRRWTQICMPSMGESTFSQVVPLSSLRKRPPSVPAKMWWGLLGWTARASRCTQEVWARRSGSRSDRRPGFEIARRPRSPGRSNSYFPWQPPQIVRFGR